MKITQNELYIVQENDTLSSIAKKYNVNPTSILIINNIPPKNIQKGFVLYIPSQN